MQSKAVLDFCPGCGSSSQPVSPRHVCLQTPFPHRPWLFQRVLWLLTVEGRFQALASFLIWIIWFSVEISLLRTWFETQLMLVKYLSHPLYRPPSSLWVSMSSGLLQVNYFRTLFKSLVVIRPTMSIKQPISFLALLKLHYGLHTAM